MADPPHLDTQQNTDPESLKNFPVPLSPRLPTISKNIELNRALTASSTSSLFRLSRTDVLFEDDWLIAVNKPQGIYCEAVLSAVPGLLGCSSGSAQLGNPASMGEFHLANRLDRDTSGVMLITKTHKVAAKLVKAFTDHKVKKTYLAFCVGPSPKWLKITVKSGHGRSKHGAWRVYASSDVGRTLPGGSVVRDMETLFEVLSVDGLMRFEESTKPRKDEAEVIVVEDKSMVESDVKKEILVRAYPQSGRTHQIRLHCQFLGIPIKGDVKYEGVHEWDGRTYDGHQLHAESLFFEHPVTGGPVLVQAPLPLWASQVLEAS